MARLEADLVDGLASNIAILGTLVPGAKQAHRDSRTATTAQRSRLGEAFLLLSAIRTAVGHTDARPEVTHFIASKRRRAAKTRPRRRT